MERRPEHPIDALKGVLTRFYPLQELAYLTAICHDDSGFQFEYPPAMERPIADVVIALGADLNDALAEVEAWFRMHAGPAVPPPRSARGLNACRESGGDDAA